MSSKLGDLKIHIGAATDGLEKGLSKAKSMLGGFGSSLMSIPGLGTLLGGGWAAKGLLDLGDSYVDLNSRLTTLLGSSKDAEAAQQALFDMSQKTKSSVLDNANAYTRLTIASQMTGLSAEENVAVLGALNEIFAQSGTSADEAKRAIVQLSQGLASGLLQGDELRSLRENAPLLLQRLADQLGVTAGDLKQMGADGELTSERLGEAFRNIAAEASISLGETVPNTAGRGMTVVFNAFQKVWDSIMDNTGLIDYIVTALQGVADWILANEGVFVQWATTLRDYMISQLLPGLLSMRDSFLEVGEKIISLAPIVGQFVAESLPQLATFISRIDEMANAVERLFNWLARLKSSPLATINEWADSIDGGADIRSPEANQARRMMSSTNNLIFNGAYSRSDVVNIATEMARRNYRR